MTRYQVFIQQQFVLLPPAAVVYSRYPDRTAVRKRVTPLESSHGHHLPTRAASARAVRGRCFGPKRAATALGCRACSASPEHRVGSLLIVGQDQTQAHSSRGTRGSWTTPDDGLRIHSFVRSRCRTEFLAEGRASVGLYTTASACARSS